jgi:hypothetical protein
MAVLAQAAYNLHDQAGVLAVAEAAGFADRIRAPALAGMSAISSPASTAAATAGPRAPPAIPNEAAAAGSPS